MEWSVCNNSTGAVMEGQDSSNTSSTPDLPSLEIPIIIVNMYGIVADILIVYTIGRLQNPTRLMVCIANWSVCNTLFLMSFLWIYSGAFWPRNKLYVLVLPYLNYHTDLFLDSQSYFITIVILHWYITTQCSLNRAINCRKLFKSLLIIGWIHIIIHEIMFMVHCITHRLFSITTIMYIVNRSVKIAVALIPIAICILRLIMAKTSNVLVVKSHLGLIFATLYYLSWLPFELTLLIPTDNELFSISYYRSCYIIICSYAVIVLALLYRYDYTFRKRFRTLCGSSGIQDTNNIDLSAAQITSQI